MKKEVVIPSGVKATIYQDGDKVVIEYEEKRPSSRWHDRIEEVFVPKEGDFVALTHTNNISGASLLCFSDIRKSGDYHCYFGLSNAGHFSLENTYFSERITGVRLMTDSEKQRLLDAMRKAGKDWDEVNKKVVDYDLKRSEFIAFAKFAKSYQSSRCVEDAYNKWIALNTK